MFSIKKSIVFLVVFALLAWTACDSDSKDPGEPCVGSFNQTDLFNRLVDNIILPAYNDLAVKVANMETASADFMTSQQIGDLENLRNAWKAAYVSYQTAAQFEFGPAEDQLLRTSLNNFPANVEEINANISSGTYDLNAADRFDRGFPALDYLLYGIADSDEAILALYTDDGQINENYRNYLSELVANIKEKVDAVQSAWPGYSASFVSNTGTAAGTSLSLLINNWNQAYEIIKRDKIGVPSGVVTLGFIQPQSVEALHSGISLELAKTALKASQDLYSSGLDELTIFVDAQKNGESLDQLIKNQFTAAINAMNEIDGPLSQAVDQDSEDVIAAYNELVKQIVQIKTDLPSVLCIAITYVDNPSDSD